MELTTTVKNIRISPRKARIVAAAVKDLPLEAAIEQLPFLVKKAGRPVLKALKATVADAVKNRKIEEGKLRLKNILVDEGLKMKRRDTSHGARFGGGTIQKRAAHIKVILTTNDQN
jgi:large subunit ribosomal protein L22